MEPFIGMKVNKKFDDGYYYEGDVKVWYPDGSLFQHFKYKKGHEDGAQKVWKSDGRIKANYVVRDGRRYGLTGVKNCINVSILGRAS